MTERQQDPRDPMLEEEPEVAENDLPARNGDNLPNTEKGDATENMDADTERAARSGDGPTEDGEDYAERFEPGSAEPDIEKRSRGYGVQSSGGPG